MPVHLPKINRLTRPSSLFPGFPEISLPIDFEPSRLYFRDYKLEMRNLFQMMLIGLGVLGAQADEVVVKEII